jgi:hypothetical protein
MVVTVPLTDLTDSNGPTEFLTGSHVEAAKGGMLFWENATKTGEAWENSRGGTEASGKFEYVTPSLSLRAKKGYVVVLRTVVVVLSSIVLAEGNTLYTIYHIPYTEHFILYPHHGSHPLYTLYAIHTVRFTHCRSVVVFDLRTRHRGRSNKSKKPRSILYMSYVQNWFRDPTNFKPKHTRQWDGLPSKRQRTLFSRVDSRRYTELLEKELESRGVDLAALASQLEYKSSDNEM